MRLSSYRLLFSADLLHHNFDALGRQMNIHLKTIDDIQPLHTCLEGMGKFSLAGQSRSEVTRSAPPRMNGAVRLSFHFLLLETFNPNRRTSRNEVISCYFATGLMKGNELQDVVTVTSATFGRSPPS